LMRFQESLWESSNESSTQTFRAGKARRVMAYRYFVVLNLTGEERGREGGRERERERERERLCCQGKKKPETARIASFAFCRSWRQKG
jgi:hypothetical protein